MNVSVITICYNDPDIKKTCESIINQTYQDFEWIVIDGGSNQETLDLLNNYKPRINNFVSEHDKGIYNAMNKGINLANGRYIHFLNAGDSYNDERSLEKAVKHLTDSDIVYGNLKFLEGDKTYIRKYPNKIPKGWLYFDSLPHPASFIKKELFEKYGQYNENYKVVSDWEKWIEFIEVEKCSYKHIPLLIADHNHNGISAVCQELSANERREVQIRHYGTCVYEELSTKKYIKLSRFTVMKIVKKFNKTYYYLFGVLPICKTIKN